MVGLLLIIIFPLVLRIPSWQMIYPQVHKNFIMANEFNSAKLCERLYTSCEDKMDRLQVLRLPSMAKFNAGFLQCNRSFEIDCVGPSKTSYENRMMKVIS